MNESEQDHEVAAITANELEALRARLLKVGLLIVPIEPSNEMIAHAYYDALAEDAAGVWRSMIELCDRSILKG